MPSIRDSSTLPFSPRCLAIRALLTALGFLAVLHGPEALYAQIALELQPGSALIWSAGAAPERMSMPAHRLPNVAVAAEGGHVIAGEDLETGNLFFLHLAAGRSVELPAPPSQTGVLRSAPILLTVGDRLEGTAWLEGSSPQDFTVLAAAWNGTSWENVETVSIQETGPQLALSATVLDDGSWLLLWAGYDGTDDDIFWSRRTEGSWSRPRRLHANNGVPDILPTVTAQGETAHAAWSSFDGEDYRIRTARWNAAGWTLGPSLAGRGSGRPAFESVAGRSFLTYHTVIPEVWNLVEFDLAGVHRPAAVASSYRERPLVVLDRDSRPTLAWPWRSEAKR